MTEKKKKADSVNEPISEGYQIAEKTEAFRFLEMAKKLPYPVINDIVKELIKMLKQNSNKSDIEFSSFLLKGPVMADNQFEEYQKLKEFFNKWRLK